LSIKAVARLNNRFYSDNAGVTESVMGDDEDGRIARLERKRREGMLKDREGRGNTKSAKEKIRPKDRESKSKQPQADYNAPAYTAEPDSYIEAAPPSKPSSHKRSSSRAPKLAAVTAAPGQAVVLERRRSSSRARADAAQAPTGQYGSMFGRDENGKRVAPMTQG
jgi:hypothetical protein